MVFVIALGILLGGNQVYQHYLVNQPLEQSLTAMPGIEKVDIAKVEGQYQVTVHLKDIDNLQEGYTAIEKTLQDSLKNRPFRLIIAESDDARLKSAFVDLQPAVYEALASNRYVWLEEAVQAYADKSGIGYHMYVDDRYLYLHFTNNGANLYHVIERQNSIQKIS